MQKKMYTLSEGVKLMNTITKKVEEKVSDKNHVPTPLSIPKAIFNPRIIKLDVDDERFFAYESQKSHH